MKRKYHLGMAFLVLLLTSGLASATIIDFSGRLDVIDDFGGARYSGATTDQVFSGSFSYGTLSEAVVDTSFPGDYDFFSPFDGEISNGITTTSGSNTEPVQVTVEDNFVLDADAAALLNNLLGTLLSEGDVVDIADIDTTFVSMTTGVRTTFGLSFISLDPNAWTGQDFANFPLESGNYDHAIFFISEQDNMENPLFDGLGVLDSVTVVPIPAALWLFAAGLLGLIGIARRKQAAC